MPESNGTRNDMVNPKGQPLNEGKVLPRRILTTQEIDVKINENIEYIDIALPFLRMLMDVIQHTKAAIFLTDNEGCILSIVSGSEMESIFAKELVIPGTYPLGSTILAKAVGQSIADNKPVIIRSGNFIINQSNGEWLGFAAPIVTKDNQTLGCVAVCLPGETLADNFLSLVKYCSASIVKEHEGYKEKNRAFLIKNQQEAIFNSHAFNDVAVNSKGEIYLISRNACNLFGVNAHELIMKNLSHILKEWERLHNTLRKSKELVDIEVNLINIPNAGRYLFNARPITLENGKADGAICTFRCMKQVMNEVNMYIGNSANLTFDDIIAVSDTSKKLIKEAKRIACLDTHVLIFGEVNTGKEAIAQAIHSYSLRSGYGFVRVDLTKIAEERMEDELFGYNENSKPHIKRRPKPGALDFANGGSLYINEVGLLPPWLQTKLLDVLQKAKKRRVGDEVWVDVDVHVIASSTINLDELIERGLFRLDLFYLLSKNSLTILPLCKRKHDIPLFLKHFLSIKSLEVNQEAPTIPKKIENILKRYAWPNNIKELEEFCEIIIKDNGMMFESFKNEKVFKSKYLFLEQRKAMDSIKCIEDSERDLILKAYSIYNGSVSKTARKLGISRNTLYLKLKRYGIAEEKLMEA